MTECGLVVDVSLCGLLPCGLVRNPHMNSFSCTSEKKGFDRHYKSVKWAASLRHCTTSAAIIFLKCGADFHYTACIPGIPGLQRWITGKPEWGRPTAMTGGRKGTSLEWEHLSELQVLTFI